MRRKDAQVGVLREWDIWRAKNPHEPANGTVAFIFYGYLRTERSDLLTFKTSGDRWQDVHGWLINGRRVDS
jgi:hypothetical protein